MLTRRRLLGSLPALAAASRVMAQAGKPPIPARKLSQMTLNVSDLKRLLDFYQGLFGMPVQARQGSRVLLRVGAGPQYLALQPADAGAKPGFSHFGIGVDNFEAGRAMQLLTGHGVMQSSEPGPMKARIRMRQGTAELYLTDPAGIVVQLQDTRYCGGSGELGLVCAVPEPSPRKGLLAFHDLRARPPALAGLLPGDLRAVCASPPGTCRAGFWSGDGASIPDARGRRR